MTAVWVFPSLKLLPVTVTYVQSGSLTRSLRVDGRPIVAPLRLFTKQSPVGRPARAVKLGRRPGTELPLRLAGRGSESG